MCKWISLEGNYGVGKTSLLKFMEKEYPSLYTCMPEMMNFNVLKHRTKFVHNMKRLIAFETLVPRIIDHRPVGHTGYVFTDGAGACIQEFNTKMVEPKSIDDPLVEFQMPDLMVFLKFPCLETNYYRSLSARYSMDQLTQRQHFLEEMRRKFLPKTIVVDIDPDDLPCDIHDKVLLAVNRFFSKNPSLDDLPRELGISFANKFTHLFCDLNYLPEHIRSSKSNLRKK